MDRMNRMRNTFYLSSCSSCPSLLIPSFITDTHPLAAGGSDLLSVALRLQIAIVLAGEYGSAVPLGRIRENM
jgi:hypothetical protein